MIENNREAVIQLKEKRNSLQNEILRELNELKEHPDALLIKHEIDEIIEILKKDNLSGEDADRVSDILTSLSLLDIGSEEVTDRLSCQWDILYPIEIEIWVDDEFAIQQMRELM
ncbi:hypothetical protein KAI56_03305 [Candidatus Parcubacteria bacterium]|nr:hypothetical protein [Candidatus Parcubacteria bacterium]